MHSQAGREGGVLACAGEVVGLDGKQESTLLRAVGRLMCPSRATCVRDRGTALGLRLVGAHSVPVGLSV